MCMLPATVATGMMVASTAAGTAAALAQGQAAQRQAEFQAAQAEMQAAADKENSRIADENARELIQAQRDQQNENELNAAANADKLKFYIEEVRQSAEKNNVSGMSVDNIIHTAQLRFDRDKNAEFRANARAVRGFGRNAEDAFQQRDNFLRSRQSSLLSAEAARAAGKDARTASYLNAAGQLLGGTVDTIKLKSKVTKDTTWGDLFD